MHYFTDKLDHPFILRRSQKFLTRSLLFFGKSLVCCFLSRYFKELEKTNFRNFVDFLVLIVWNFPRNSCLLDRCQTRHNYVVQNSFLIVYGFYIGFEWFIDHFDTIFYPTRLLKDEFSVFIFSTLTIQYWRKTLGSIGWSFLKSDILLTSKIRPNIILNRWISECPALSLRRFTSNCHFRYT